MTTRRALVRVVIPILVALLVAIVWVVSVFYSELTGVWHNAIAKPGDVATFQSAVMRELDARKSGNSAFVLIEQGRVVKEHYTSSGTPVSAETVFQVASLSKWVTAWGVMKLVEQGKLDLDTPVSTYLKRWKLQESAFDNAKVNARRLLSHTAGLTDGLGFAGFAPGEPVQRLEDALDHASDASPGKDGHVRVGREPGKFFYSGGGYALLQLLIEDVSGEPFDVFMAREVLTPLGMTHSTFAQPPPGADVAQSLDADGQPAPLMQFSAPAAAGLYTSASDLTRLVLAMRAGENGEPVGRSVLTAQTLERMRQPEARTFGVPVWGLGTVLFAPTKAGGFIVGHDGVNTPAINTAVRVDPATGDGMVLLETGTENLATRLCGEWVYWKTGELDLFMMPAAIAKSVMVAGAGVFVIVIGLVAWFVVQLLRKKTL